MSAARPRCRPDAELVDAALGGDKDAFGELVRRHGSMCHRAAARMLGDADLAGEAVQEASLLAYLSLARLRAPARFGAWFCGITLNLARRSLRERRRVVALDDPSELAAAGTEQPFEAADIASVVRDAVSRLPPGQRRATLLYYWRGLTQVEIAAELRISVDAVKNRLHHARVALTRPLAAALAYPEVTMSMEPEPTWIDVSVAEVRRGEDADPGLRPHMVLLRERRGDRALPVWIGRAEATALAMLLETEEMPRPMTCQLTAGLVHAAGARVRQVRITRLVDRTFYAAVLLDGPAGAAEVDARPSDAINLALVTGAPLRVDARLLADGGRATARTEWRDYPTDGPRLISELRQQQDALMARLDRACP